MKKKFPEVTVLMPVYNSEKYISEAIISILNQSFSNFKFIIIDDASTDNTVNIINTFKDRRIRLIQNQTNVGNNNARNVGLKNASGKYICAMDSDDIAPKYRIEKQFNFMEENKEFGICGGQRKIIGIDGKYMPPSNYEELKVRLTGQMCFVHPTLFFRASLLKKHSLKYNETYRFAADYDLMVRSAYHFPVTNIPEIMVEYRKHSEQITTAKANEQGKIADIIRLKQLNFYEIIPNKEQAAVHLALMNRRKIRNEKQFERLQLWANYLIEKNSLAGYYNSIQLSYFLKSLLKYIWKDYIISQKS